MASQNFDNLKRALIILEAESVRLITSGYYQPAVDTGRLRQSITSQVVLFTGTQAEGLVGTNVFYAIYVHEGTIFMRKRPFLADALKNKQVEIQAIFVGGYRKTIRKVAIR